MTSHMLSPPLLRAVESEDLESVKQLAVFNHDTTNIYMVTPAKRVEYALHSRSVHRLLYTGPAEGRRE